MTIFLRPNLEVNVEWLNKRGFKTQTALIPFLSETMQFFRTLGRMFDCFFFCQFPHVWPNAHPASIFHCWHCAHKSDEYLWTDLWTILKEQFPVPRNTAASKIEKGAISLLWKLPCHCNPDHNKFSSLIQLGWQFFEIFVYGDVVYRVCNNNWSSQRFG